MPPSLPPSQQGPLRLYFPPKNRKAWNRGTLFPVPQPNEGQRGSSVLTSNNMITAICFSLITLTRLWWITSRKTSAESESLLEEWFNSSAFYRWNAAIQPHKQTHTHTHKHRLRLQFKLSSFLPPTVSQTPSATLEICPQSERKRPTGELYM